ncbi:hypothetical protein MKMG_01874 [Methanogenium sp. MK-MG]|nr:hypothetical protein MKMG_01874 [Methanogenium sp. MK-MG]
MYVKLLNLYLMKFFSKEISQSLLITTVGVLLGVIGNFMVVTYYRIADQMNLGSLSADISMLLCSVIIMFTVVYYIIKSVNKQTDE